jgi:hypothetical protein
VFSLFCVPAPPPPPILSSSSLFCLLIFRDCVFSLVCPHHVAVLDRFIRSVTNSCFLFVCLFVCLFVYLHSVASWLSFLTKNRPYLSHALPCVWLTSNLIDFYETLCQPEWLYFVCEGSSGSHFDLSRKFTRSPIVRSFVGRNLGLVLIMCLCIHVCYVSRPCQTVLSTFVTFCSV